MEVFELLPAGHGWAQKTVNTFLTRLVEKGVLAVTREGKANSYTARFKREECVAAEGEGRAAGGGDGAELARAQCYGLHMGEYLEKANDEVMTILMIEHIKAVENIDEILKVKGVDSVMVGALDLSGSMGMLGQTGDPKVEDAVQKVLASCKRAGVPCGIITVAPEQANARIKQGFTNLIVGIDVLFLHGAARSALGQITKPSGGG